MLYGEPGGSRTHISILIHPERVEVPQFRYRFKYPVNLYTGRSMIKLFVNRGQEFNLTYSLRAVVNEFRSMMSFIESPNIPITLSTLS